jgi:lysophospholipase L1-like esterase
MAAACGSGPTGPGGGTAPPQISCGSSVTVDNVAGLTQTVDYPAPGVTGGAAPVNLACTPSSGSSFPLGSTTVNCTASDAQSRTATCSFGVTLTHRQLTTTKFLAFGDSLTAGENGRPFAFAPVIDVPNAYPTILQQFFNERIPSQTFTVVNAGLNGERVTDTTANERLKGAIARNQPQVLLLLEGINDINNGVGPNSVVNGIRDQIRTARDRGVQYVFVSTLLPVSREDCRIPPAPRCRADDTPQAVLLQTNQLIRSMVPANGAQLVDPFDDFVANHASYIDADGLHMKPEGYRALASAFWDRIVQVIPATALFGS